MNYICRVYDIERLINFLLRLGVIIVNIVVVNIIRLLVNFSF